MTINWPLDRVTEHEVKVGILDLLSDGNVWSNAQIKGVLGSRLPLSAGDRVRANKRPNEEKWYELVNNALSPSRSNSLPTKGLTEVVGRGLHRITEKGKKEAERHAGDKEEMIRAFGPELGLTTES